MQKCAVHIQKFRNLNRSAPFKHDFVSLFPVRPIGRLNSCQIATISHFPVLNDGRIMYPVAEIQKMPIIKRVDCSFTRQEDNKQPKQRNNNGNPAKTIFNTQPGTRDTFMSIVYDKIFPRNNVCFAIKHFIRNELMARPLIKLCVRFVFEYSEANGK